MNKHVFCTRKMRVITFSKVLYKISALKVSEVDPNSNFEKFVNYPCQCIIHLFAATIMQ